MILYSAKSTIDAEGQSAYRVTKFNDGEVESSYLTNGVTCDCPAGVRPTCRHRQMLPQMIAEGIINTHWFLDWDGGREIVDFEGINRQVYEAVAEREAPQDVTCEPASEALQGDLLDRQTFTVPAGYEAVRDVEGRATGEIRPTTTPASPTPWRRL